MIIELLERAVSALFDLVDKQLPSSPFDVKGVKTRVKTKDIMAAMEVSRSGEGILKR